MDRLWTPWRLSYVTDASRTDPQACVFCSAVEAPEREALVVHRGTRAFVILNKFPYNNGHVMVVPVRHVGTLAELEAADLHEMMALAQRVERVLTDVYRPHGFNMGINLGRPAGAGILDHLHLHIVPRWNGDTSFMTVFDDTRVLPEELAETARRLRSAFAELHASTPAG